MSTIVTFKKDGKKDKVEVTETAESIYLMLDNAVVDDNYQRRYNKPDFISLTRPDGRKVIFNRHFINVIYE